MMKMSSTGRGGIDKELGVHGRCWLEMGGCWGEDRDGNVFSDSKKVVCLRGMVLRLVSIDEQKSGTETYSDTSWPGGHLA